MLIKLKKQKEATWHPELMQGHTDKATTMTGNMTHRIQKFSKP